MDDFFPATNPTRISAKLSKTSCNGSLRQRLEASSMAPAVGNSQRRKLGIGLLILLLPAAGYALLRVQSSRTTAPAAAPAKTVPATSSTAGYAADADDAAVDLQRRLESGEAKL